MIESLHSYISGARTTAMPMDHWSLCWLMTAAVGLTDEVPPDQQSRHVWELAGRAGRHDWRGTNAAYSPNFTDERPPNQQIHSSGR